MKISEITDEAIREYCGMPDCVKILGIYKSAAKSFIMSYTGLNEDGLDKYEDLTIAYCVLINDMSYNKDYTIQNDKLNPTVQTILNLYSKNLLG